MNRSDFITAGALPGALGGVVGGLVFGAAMLDLGALTSVGSIVRVESSAVGFVVNMAIAATVGSGLGLMVWQQRPGMGETLLWGMVYGTLWWFIGSLTLFPLFLGDGVTWDAESAQEAFPALLGHVLYGSSAALAIIVFQMRHQSHRTATRVTVGALLRGGIASLLAAWMIGAILSAQGQLPAFVGRTDADSHATVWSLTLLVGLVAGAGFALLYPRPADGAGPGLVRGAMYGLLAWIVAPLSVLSVVDGSGLPWTVAEVRGSFSGFPGYVLFGAGLSLLYGWLGAMGRLLFSDTVPGGDDEGIGTQGLRALARGVVSGLVGGLAFTAVMVQTGSLGGVADLVGATSTVAGFFVHLAIAVIVGASYGLLFRRQSFDIGSALGWGVTYGFIWWNLGSLTLMPVILGTTPDWTADVVAGVFPHLIGHLMYGAGLGITFYFMEARHRPWWIPLREAEVARVARRGDQVLTSAPALWTLVVVISQTLPVLLGTDGPRSFPARHTDGPNGKRALQTSRWRRPPVLPGGAPLTAVERSPPHS